MAFLHLGNGQVCLSKSVYGREKFDEFGSCEFRAMISCLHIYMYIQPIPLGVTFSNAVSKLKVQSLNVSFATFQ